MIWKKDILTKNKKEIIQSAIISFIISLVFLLYAYSIGNTFSWQSISPFEAPSILNRMFYTVFTFSTIGAFLFFVVKLWKGLYFIFVTIFNSRKLYNLVKALVWFGLTLLSYFYIVPFAINFLNKVTSFLFNIFNFLLYLSPFLGIFLILSVVTIYLFLKFKKEPIVITN